MLRSSFTPHLIEAGCDEVGRGSLAGPVVAAAVIFPKNYRNEFINDSKKLSPKTRCVLRAEIEKKAIAWSVAEVSHEEIDRINILQASFRAMHRALDKLTARPSLVLVDGNRFLPYGDLAFQCIVGGDSHYLSIAAASILAKTHRDDLMTHLSKAYPIYGWHTNKGYPTWQHREAIKKWGLTFFHRKSFHIN